MTERGFDPDNPEPTPVPPGTLERQGNRIGYYDEQGGWRTVALLVDDEDVLDDALNLLRASRTT